MIRSEILFRGVNFTNVLRAAFMHVGPKSTKIQSSYQTFFALLGSGHIKALSKQVDEIDPRKQSYNKGNFLYVSQKDQISLKLLDSPLH
jgi:hypothetical protein